MADNEDWELLTLRVEDNIIRHITAWRVYKTSPQKLLYLQNTVGFIATGITHYPPHQLGGTGSNAPPLKQHFNAVLIPVRTPAKSYLERRRLGRRMTHLHH